MCANCGHDRSDHDRGYMLGAWQFGRCWGLTIAGCGCLQYVPDYRTSASMSSDP